jgi:hypothetical protein
LVPPDRLGLHDNLAAPLIFSGLGCSQIMQLWRNADSRVFSLLAFRLPIGCSYTTVA